MDGNIARKMTTLKYLEDGAALETTANERGRVGANPLGAKEEECDSVPPLPSSGAVCGRTSPLHPYRDNLVVEASCARVSECFGDTICKDLPFWTLAAPRGRNF